MSKPHGLAVFIAAALALAAACSAAKAGPRPVEGISADSISPAGIIAVVDRPEIRSYQPYSGLQYGFRPDPPVQRGVERRRPEVIMPTRRAPLIPYGAPSPYSAQWYSYCAEKYESFEPRTGLYTTYSGRKRACR